MNRINTMEFNYFCHLKRKKYILLFIDISKYKFYRYIYKNMAYCRHSHHLDILFTVINRLKLNI